MIRMSKETDYGIVVLAYFASAQAGLKHNAREVAMENQLPLPMVRKILKILAREGLLISHRGAKGGYSLVRRGGEDLHSGNRQGDGGAAGHDRMYRSPGGVPARARLRAPHKLAQNQ